jgi:transcription initiation factor TFIIIB Brf1 subunit/transcription initiation factor TFIIB
VKKKKMKTKMKGKSKRGKAIIGIAMAAIMVASVMVAMIGSTGAKSEGGEYNIIERYVPTEVQPVLIGQDVSFTAWGTLEVIE